LKYSGESDTDPGDEHPCGQKTNGIPAPHYLEGEYVQGDKGEESCDLEDCGMGIKGEGTPTGNFAIYGNVLIYPVGPGRNDFEQRRGKGNNLQHGNAHQ
jgi:hypothetical protein